MKAWVESSSRGLRIGLSWVSSFLLWTLWLALTVLLVCQLYVLSANELAIPDFVLRHLESRLAESGLRATFSRTSFDPAGRVLIENVRLSLPAFAEPVVTARSVFVRLNPWPLVVGKIEPREVHLTEVSAAVPAMLSPSGQPEEIVRNFDAIIEPTSKAITFRQLSGDVGGVKISAHGILMLPPAGTKKPALDALGEMVAKRFTTLTRQALALAEQVRQFEEPTLQLEFSASESGAPTIQVLALARTARLTKPFAAEIVNFRAVTRLLLFGDAPPSDVEVSASELRLPNDSNVRGVKARIIGRFRLEGSQFDLRELAITADTIATSGINVHAISARVFPLESPRFETSAVAHIFGAPMTMSAEIDPRSRLGTVRFEGAVSPQVIDFAGNRARANVRKYVDFESLTADRGEARFGADWTFEKLKVRVNIPRLNSNGIIMEDGHATLELDSQRLHAPEAFARVGKNFARGSYEHNLANNHYRFLLQGQVRPLEISKWFRPWWTTFFQQFEFPVAPLQADVDVRGAWRDGRQANVFVFADAPKPIIRGAELDRLRTRLFIRPAFFDGLELLATRDQGKVHGRFTYIGNPETHAWRTLDLAIDSTLDLKIAAQLLGPAGANPLAPFRLAAPPTLMVRGQFSGPDAPPGAKDKLRIEARTEGEFRYREFPLRDVAFVAILDRDEVILDDFKGKFGGGAVGGHARVWGVGAQRRLGFDFSLDDAGLGQVAAGLGEFFAAQKGQAPTPPGKFVQEKANVRLNLAASAEGRYDDPLSYHGEGSAVLHGAELGEVPLLGMLSELLKFTALRFTDARANFKVEGPRLVFPAVTLRGANSAIDAHGAYALDRRELDFNAKIFPFQESDNLIKSVVGAVLTPLSNAFEVKLTGSLTKPQWAFAMGPTNFLRSLGPTGEAASKAGAPPEERRPRPNATVEKPAPQ